MCNLSEQDRQRHALRNSAACSMGYAAAMADYYRHELARIHHEEYGFHGDAVAPGILALLQPVLERGGTVVELGCGSGLLTSHLLDAGHRVVATDASRHMLELARAHAPGATCTVSSPCRMIPCRRLTRSYRPGIRSTI